MNRCEKCNDRLDESNTSVVSESKCLCQTCHTEMVEAGVINF